MMDRYRLILADPAWRYSNVGVKGAAEGHYKADDATGRATMALDEICRLPVRAIADDDAVLLLWATWPLLVDAFRVIAEWGFLYVTGLPWIKITNDPSADLFGDVVVRPQWGSGWWVRGCSEPLLIAKRGKARPPDEDRRFVGLLSENFAHSRKPDSVYQFAETLPGPYLELFARRRRPGWDAWGNEVDGSIVLPEIAAHG